MEERKRAVAAYLDGMNAGRSDLRVMMFQQAIDAALAADDQRHAGRDRLPRGEPEALVPRRHQCDARAAQFGVELAPVLGVGQRVQVDRALRIVRGEARQIDLRIGSRRRAGDGAGMAAEVDAAQHQSGLPAQARRHARGAGLVLRPGERRDAQMALLDARRIVAEAPAEKGGEGLRRLARLDVGQPGYQHVHRPRRAEQIAQRLAQQRPDRHRHVGLAEQRALRQFLFERRARVLGKRLVGGVAHVVDQRRASPGGLGGGNRGFSRHPVVAQPDRGFRTEADVAAAQLGQAGRAVARLEDKIACRQVARQRGGIGQRHQRHGGGARMRDLVGRRAGHDANDLRAAAVGGAEGAKEISVEAVDAAELAAPLRGKRNQCVHSLSCAPL
ncbi:MAG: hypothetical protein IPL03_13965 [Sterolibacteriaceae bacterium]|nr:hypothetical protein [Candidatus Methylophosphatis haderslevensis]